MQLPNSIAAAIQVHGIKPVIGVLARALVSLAHAAGNDLAFNCDLGTVIIERKTIKTND
ncbi:hypothetical protein [Pseudoalteromonas rhizosphaerae]|uniref:hypothetical protein n=1 Tax=Pseudoalteromonas rhizosphaerae TaxID=2518973 RepID=UPI0015D2B554|nr:hypothetical protein [Pseudoalteromonas rhizosphaerae]